MVLVVSARRNHLKNEPRMLVFEGGGGGGGGKEQPPSKASRVCSFSRVEVVKVLEGITLKNKLCGWFSRVVMVLLARSNLPQKRAYPARFRGW